MYSGNVILVSARKMIFASSLFVQWDNVYARTQRSHGTAQKLVDQVTVVQGELDHWAEKLEQESLARVETEIRAELQGTVSDSA
mgnify:CR=1 FL=1